MNIKINVSCLFTGFVLFLEVTNELIVPESDKLGRCASFSGRNVVFESSPISTNWSLSKHLSLTRNFDNKNPLQTNELELKSCNDFKSQCSQVELFNLFTTYSVYTNILNHIAIISLARK